ncbi:MAG: radical SAM protein, partial [Pyrobaculum sp.]
LGPVIPGFNDDPSDLREVVEAAHAASAEVVYDRYRPKPRADATLASTWRKVVATPQWWARTKKTIEQICAEVGAKCIDVEKEWRAARQRRR